MIIQVGQNFFKGGVRKKTEILTYCEIILNKNMLE